IVAMLAVCALWFTVLKPKDPGADTAASDPTAPGVTGLSNDVNAGKDAAAKVQAATGGTEAKTGTTATATAPATAKPKSGATGGTAPSKTAKAKTTDASAPLLRALAPQDHA